MQRMKELLSVLLACLFMFQPFLIADSLASRGYKEHQMSIPCAEPMPLADIIEEDTLHANFLKAAPGTGTFPFSSINPADMFGGENNASRNPLQNRQGTVENELMQKDIRNAIGRLPVLFTENRGQVNEQVKYYAKLGGSTIYFTDNEIVFDFIRAKGHESGKRIERHRMDMEKASEKREYVRHVVRMKLNEANPNSLITGREKQAGIVSYFKGNDPSKWRSNIPTYGEVFYQDVYAGIDLRFYAARNGSMEYDFIVRPCADPEKIAVSFEGIDGMRIDENGDLIIKTALGEMRQKAPHIYQMVNGERIEIAGGFRIAHNREEGEDEAFESEFSAQRGEFSFQIASYNKAQPLVIDPLLASSSFGGNSFDGYNTLELDTQGNVYVMGMTESHDFPITAGAYDTSHTDSDSMPLDVFISKLNGNLTTLLASTFIGGDVRNCNAIAVDSSGNVYMTGRADSDNYPTTAGSYDTTYNNHSDIFVSKLNSNLTTLLASTFIGDLAIGYAIAVDKSGAVYITGKNYSPNYPTTIGAYDTSYSYPVLDNEVLCENKYCGGDVFVSKLNSSLTSLLASTFIDGGYEDSAYSLTIDASGNVYLAGHTFSADYPTTANAYDTLFNGYYCDSIIVGVVFCYGDAFVSKLDNNLSTLLASTFLGTNKGEVGEDIAVASSGSVFVMGYTDSLDFPTIAGAFDTSMSGSNDGFITKFDGNLSTLLSSTFIGGNCEAIAIDSSDNVYVTGYGTYDYPTTSGAYGNSFPGIFISKLDPDLSACNKTQTNELTCNDGLDNDCDLQVDCYDPDCSSACQIINYHCDGDKDGYFSKSVSGSCTGTGCQPPGCGAASGNDCDDGNPSIHPGATEVCDGIDNNCDQQIDEGAKTSYYRDEDGDGYGDPNEVSQACSPPSGYVSGNNDCNDSDPSVNPGITEGPPESQTCADQKDNDCDGLTDIADIGCTSLCADNDGDGYGNPGSSSCPAGPETDCDDSNPLIHPGAAEVCDSIDNNCNQQTDEGCILCIDNDGDGYGETGNSQCSNGSEVDCDDGDPLVYPGSVEVCDAKDNNCNQLIDEDCSIEATIGTRFTISGTGFGDLKAKVYAQYESNPGKISKKSATVESWSNTAITCLWTKKLPAGNYEMYIQPNGLSPILIGTVRIMDPVIDEVIPEQALPGAVIEINGSYFTNKKPKVYIEDPVSMKRKSCKVISWNMDPLTGNSTLQYTIPKNSYIEYDLILKTGVGEVRKN